MTGPGALIPLLLLLLSGARPGLALVGCVHARGQVFCDGSPAAGVNVRLIDVDEVELGVLSRFLSMLNPDDLMDRTMSSESGEYELSGCAADFDWLVMNNEIDPFIFFTHRCNQKEETVMVKVDIHQKNNGYGAEFDAGIIELRHADAITAL